MNNWIDKYITEQKEQREIINKTIAPFIFEDICNIIEIDETF